jgi:acetolactate synthase small subunit
MPTRNRHGAAAYDGQDIGTGAQAIDEHIERELVLVKVTVSQDNENKLPNLIDSVGARVLDDCPETYTLEWPAATDRSDECSERLGACADIRSIGRSGAMASARGHPVLAANT